MNEIEMKGTTLKAGKKEGCICKSFDIEKL